MKLGDNGEAFFVQETEECNVRILGEPGRTLRVMFEDKYQGNKSPQQYQRLSAPASWNFLVHGSPLIFPRSPPQLSILILPPIRRQFPPTW